ncbi:MAG TPA: hypothetical protein VJ553_02935 [Candidatus Paceibacterota bacterium]|nr:hypothetical protein [Candidatus Paceibacterota bacterium]
MPIPKEYRWSVAASLSVFVATLLVAFAWMVTALHLLERQLVPGERFVTVFCGVLIAIGFLGYYVERRVGEYVLYKLFLRRHAVIVLSDGPDEVDS